MNTLSKASTLQESIACIEKALGTCPASPALEEALRAIQVVSKAFSQEWAEPAYLHDDQDISQDQWNALIEGMTPVAAGRVANWLAHGMKCIKKPDGVRMERKDYARRGVCLFIDLNGEQKELPLILSSPQCLIWYRRWNHQDEFYPGEIRPLGEKWQPFFPR